MIRERIPKSKILQAPDRAWNRDGYLSNVAFGTEILKLGLGEILAVDPYEGHLLRFSMTEGRSVMDLVLGDLYVPLKERSLVPVDHLHRPAALETLTDICLSPETRMLYVLDATTGVLSSFRLASAGSDSYILIEVSEVRLSLPPKVALTQSSRIAVVTRVIERPERRDPYVYISCPESSVILQVDIETGVAKVGLGVPGRSGTTRVGKIGAALLVGHPSALYFDEPSGLLYWADAENHAVFSMRERFVARVSEIPAEVELSSLLVYRLKDHVDVPMNLQLDEAAISPNWEEGDPALLFATGAHSCQLFKICLHGRDRPLEALFDLAPRHLDDPGRLERVMVLPNGELLISTDSLWVYNVRHNTRVQPIIQKDYVS